MATFSASDLTYILGQYRTMSELCADREWSAAQVEELAEAGRLPAATYVLPSGERRYPPDYFALVDAFGLDALEAGFRERFLAAGGSAADFGEYWTDYLGGGFGVRLRSVVPVSMERGVRHVDLDPLGVGPLPRPEAIALRA